MNYKAIAAVMLGCAPGDLPFELGDLLDEVDGMCEDVGAKLQSRQTIAMLIILYRTGLLNGGQEVLDG